VLAISRERWRGVNAQEVMAPPGEVG